MRRSASAASRRSPSPSTSATRMVVKRPLTVTQHLRVCGGARHPAGRAARRDSPWRVRTPGSPGAMLRSGFPTNGGPPAMIRSMTAPRERFGKLDIFLAALVSLAALGDMVSQVSDDIIGWGGVPLILLVTIPLLWRSKAPVEATAAVLAGVVIHWVAFPDGVRCGIALPTVLLLAFAAGARTERNRSLLGLGLGLVAGLVICMLDGPEGADIAAFT